MESAMPTHETMNELIMGLIYFAWFNVTANTVQIFLILAGVMLGWKIMARVAILERDINEIKVDLNPEEEKRRKAEEANHKTWRRSMGEE